MKYEEAYNELQEILENLESGSTPLQQLPTQVKRASQLIKFCKDELRGIQNALSSTVYDEEE